MGMDTTHTESTMKLKGKLTPAQAAARNTALASIANQIGVDKVNAAMADRELRSFINMMFANMPLSAAADETWDQLAPV